MCIVDIRQGRDQRIRRIRDVLRLWLSQEHFAVGRLHHRRYSGVSAPGDWTNIRTSVRSRSLLLSSRRRVVLDRVWDHDDQLMHSILADPARS